MIVKMIFGSHLYGTDTEESDLDYKGIFMPSVEQIYLGKIPKSYNESTKTTREEGAKNTKDDVETEMYSLHYFIKLACEGQTVAIDMLHAPDNMILESSEVWEELVKNRNKFYTKNLKAFVSYARKQAAKYGIKGSRLNEAKMVMDYLDKFDCDIRLEKIWGCLPTGEHVRFIEDSPNGIKQYQVCGKIIQETCQVNYAYYIVKQFYKNYGRRAELAARNCGIDFKAVSHAIRAAFQVKEILTKGTIVFPLEKASFLRDVKLGKLDYVKEVSPVLENLMNEVEELSKNSKLPEKTDRSYWDKFLFDTIDKQLIYEAKYC